MALSATAYIRNNTLGGEFLVFRYLKVKRLGDAPSKDINRYLIKKSNPEMGSVGVF